MRWKRVLKFNKKSMKLRMNYKQIILTFFVLLSFSTFAQNVTVKDAIEIALKQNFQIQIAQKNTAIAQTNNSWSEAGLFPTVALNVTNANAIQDNTKNPFTFTPGIILSQSVQPSLNLTWNIFSGMAVSISKLRLEQLEAQSKGNAMVIVETTISDVVKAYYSALMHKERLELLKELTQFSREQVVYYELKGEYAGSNSLELMQFRNQHFSDSTNFLMQEISYKNALRNLNLVLNLPLDSLLTLTDPLEFSLPEVNPRETQDQLYTNNQNLKNQLINIELSQIQTKLQRSFLFPTLSFQAGVQPSYSWIREIQNDLFQVETQTLMYSGNLVLRYNLFNNWKSKRAVEVSKIQEEIATLTYDEMKNSLSNTLINLLEMYHVRNRLVSLSFQNIDYANRMWSMGVERFKLGTLNSIELMALRNNYVNAKLTHLENLYNRIDTFFEISRLTGNFGLYY